MDAEVADVRAEPGAGNTTGRRPRRDTDIIAALLTELRVWRGLVIIFALLLIFTLAVLRAGGCGTPGRQILIDGKPVCLVRDERVAEAVRQRIIDEARAGLEGHAVIKERWTVEAPRLVDEDEAYKILKDLVHVQVEAYAIKVDGKPVVYLPTEADAREVLQKAIKRFTPEGVELLAKPKFRERVEVVQVMVEPEKVARSHDEALKALLTGGEKYYTVRAGDYPAKIAKRVGISLKQLYALNPGLKGKDLKAGQKLVIARTRPRLTVVTVRKLAVRKPVEPPEEISPTPSLPPGQKKVVVEGEPGEKLLTLRAVFENDRRIKAQILESRTIKQPKPRKVMVGIAPPRPATPEGAPRSSR